MATLQELKDYRYRLEYGSGTSNLDFKDRGLRGNLEKYGFTWNQFIVLATEANPEQIKKAQIAWDLYWGDRERPQPNFLEPNYWLERGSEWRRVNSKIVSIELGVREEKNKSLLKKGKL